MNSSIVYKGFILATEIEHSVETEQQTLNEHLYRVVMINDDYTPMDFVVHILIGVFAMSQADAESVMIQIHQQGRAVCGVFSMEIAEAKVHKVEMVAQKYGHPLLCIMEKDE